MTSKKRLINCTQIIKKGVIFDNLMPLILSQENILEAYREIKRNTGSTTAGTDRLTIRDIEKLSVEQVVGEVRRRLANGYQPQAVRRKEIQKPNGKKPDL